MGGEEWQGGEERWRVQTVRPMKGQCGWQPLTLVTMGFHQRQAGSGEGGGGSEKREGREKRIEKRLR